MNNFNVIACDTDSLFFTKPNNAEFSAEEAQRLRDNLNSLCPEMIEWDENGYYKTQICLKAKNYVLYDGKKIKYKGSALKSSQLETALREFLEKIIDAIIFEKYNYKEIYDRYVQEILTMPDIKRWSSKKTISEKTLQSERTNEARIRQAIEGSEYREGDKVWVYFTPDGNLKLAEHFNNDYDKTKLLKKLHNTAKRFAPVLNISDYFLDLSLKRNKDVLQSYYETNSN